MIAETVRRNIPACLPTDLRLKQVTDEGFRGPHRQLVGRLVWIAIMTRADFMNAMLKVTRRAHSPTLRHWQATLKILEYLNASSHLGVRYSGEGGGDLVAHLDTTYASYNIARSSVSGGVPSVCRRGNKLDLKTQLRVNICSC